MPETKRVLIIGGGPGGLTAAWHILQAKAEVDYEVTVLQMGWRCGGKGASGRQQNREDRILEHGLHIMFGFYQNFFSMITQVYEELDRPPGSPLATWQEAFLPGDAGMAMDEYKGRWEPLTIDFPRNAAVPGEGGALNSSGAYLGALLGVAVELAFGWRGLEAVNSLLYGSDNEGGVLEPDPSAGSSDELVRWTAKVIRDVLVIAQDISQTLEVMAPRVVKLLEALHLLVQRFGDRLSTLGRSASLLVEGLDFLTALVRGIVNDGVLLEGGYAAIDRHDFADWLCSHGMAKDHKTSIPVLFLYDAAFSFSDGRGSRPQMAAGVCVRTLMRMGFTYKGAAYYKMAAGMGDVIVAPLYLALKARGVRFAFFHMVDEVIPHPTDDRIQSVRVRRQARVKAGPYDYEPLFDVNGLPCWPATPLFDQLDGGDSLREVDFESYYASHPSDDFVELQVGRDFDEVVLATPVPCLPFIAPKLIERSSLWKTMVDKVAAVPTVSMQLWFHPTLKELGWSGPKSPLLSLYVDPLNTYSDMSQTIAAERWPEGSAPGSIAYFTGPQPTAHRLPPLPSEVSDYPRRMTEEARHIGLMYIHSHLTTLFPGAADLSGCFEWNTLVDPQDRRGAQRYLAQYWRSNAEPQEWCTLALPDTNQHRISASDTGFSNLTVAGDWIDNGFYVACLEGAVMGGIHAARAVTGTKIRIIGEELDKGLPRSDRPSAPETKHEPAMSHFPADHRIKVAVLGSGVGAMSALWGLLSSDQADRFDITVYQYGWRLGGKGASGRNREEHDRIEEHGLHIFGGTYENAFQMMRDVYGKAGRPAGAPLSSWYDPSRQESSAFWPHSEVSIADEFSGRWSFWNVLCPTNDELPGDGSLADEPAAYLQMLVELIVQLLQGQALLSRHDVAPSPGGLLGRLARVTARVTDKVAGLGVATLHAALPDRLEDRLREALAVALGANGDTGPLLDLLQTIRKALTTVAELFLDQRDHARWSIEALDLAVTVLTGVIEDRVMERGFDVVDDAQFRDWLSRHGITRLTLNGLLIRGWEDFFFAYRDGDGNRPDFSAGSALRTIFRYVFTYKGAFFWKMQAGMGDTIFAPIYEVFSAMGVRFEFFHRVTEISCLDAAGEATDSVQAISVDQQLRLAEGRVRYEPLYDVKGVPCWPSAPLWEQLDPADVARYRDAAWQLESAWGQVPPVARKTLRRGEDFDIVILGLSSKPLQTLAPTLLERSAALRAAAGMPTNQTIAAQLWLAPTLAQLGWTAGSTVGSSFSDPYQTWANMDDLIARESWEGASPAPGSLVYLTGTYTDARPIPPTDDGTFPAENSARVFELTARWLEQHWATLYPASTGPGGTGIRLADLIAPAEASGVDRLKAQYWRGNIDPSERYVLSPPGTARTRVYSDELGFTNLFGAGDWLYTGMNVGCVEGAVMGGLQASRAICGSPAFIIGNDEPIFRRRSSSD